VDRLYDEERVKKQNRNKNHKLLLKGQHVWQHADIKIPNTA
jgi:hypothetical protein